MSCQQFLVSQLFQTVLEKIPKEVIFPQHCYRRGIDGLYKVLSHPFVYPGGGCLEAAIYKALMEVSTVYTMHYSGPQPGIRLPPGAREKY
jgi:hypothetical protein